MSRQTLLALCVAVLFVGLLMPLSSRADAPKRAPRVTETEALENFDFVWKTVRDTHFDKNLNGVDWPAVRDEFRPRAAQCREILELRLILRQSLARLGQSHFGVIPSGDYISQHAANLDALIERTFTAVPDHIARPSVGVDVRVIDDLIVVTDVLDSESAHSKGVHPGWAIVEIDGYRMTEVASKLQEASLLYGSKESSFQSQHMWNIVGDLLAGEPGTSVDVVFLNHTDETIRLQLQRRDMPWELSAVGGMPPLPIRVESHYLEGPASPRIAVIKIHYVWLPRTVAAFEEALTSISDAEALVLDIRGNMGGVGQAAQGVAGFLAREQFSFGKSIGRGGEFPSLVFPRRVDRHGKEFQPLDVPLALLIDGHTGSASELFAAAFQDAKLAHLIGEPTAGAALPATITTMPNGDKLLHAIYDFVRASGERIEDNPVQPDLHAGATRRDLIMGKDIALDAAIEWVQARLLVRNGER